MTWAEIARLILVAGMPFADRMINLWLQSAAPTLEEWNALKAMAKDTSKTRMLEVLLRANIDPASETGKLFLSLVE